MFPDIYITRGTVIIRSVTPETYTSTYVFDVRTTRASAIAENVTTGTISVNGTAYDAADVESAIDGLPAENQSDRSFNLPGSSR